MIVLEWEARMSTKTVSVTEAVRNFSDYVNRVAYRHETFVLRKGRRRVAELRPLPEGRRLGDLIGILRALPQLSDGDVRSFQKDLAAARKALPKKGLTDPWAS
jgi:antitoxin (DNA-binding transcriptional repressor) of toxin-antitoxin stability system